MNKPFVRVSAGSGYGIRSAYYKIDRDVLILLYEGDHDNLSGNSIVTDFEGLTINQAREKAQAINSEPVGHSYDGCHVCTFSVDVEALSADEVPEWLTYSESSKVEIIRAALDLKAKRIGFGEFKKILEESK